MRSILTGHADELNVRNTVITRPYRHVRLLSVVTRACDATYSTVYARDVVFEAAALPQGNIEGRGFFLTVLVSALSALPRQPSVSVFPRSRTKCRSLGSASLFLPARC